MKQFFKKTILTISTLAIVFGVFAFSFQTAGAKVNWVNKLKDTDLATDVTDANNAAEQIVTRVLGVLAAVFGGLFILMMLVGAIIYMTSADTTRKDMGKNIMVLAVVGGVIGLLVGVIWLILRGSVKG